MLRRKSKVYMELKTACRYRGLYLSRLLLIILLIPISYPFRYIPFYLAFTFLVVPAIIGYSLRTNHPEQDSLYLSKVSLPDTIQSLHFSYSRYQAERISSILILFLLAVWQFFQPRILWYGLPVWLLPTILWLIYFFVGRGIALFYRFDLHYQLTHLDV